MTSLFKSPTIQAPPAPIINPPVPTVDQAQATVDAQDTIRRRRGAAATMLSSQSSAGAPTASAQLLGG
jgi:hypothetical protein